MTSDASKEDTMPCLQPHVGHIREQEGFCAFKEWKHAYLLLVLKNVIIEAHCNDIDEEN